MSTYAPNIPASHDTISNDINWLPQFPSLIHFTCVTGFIGLTYKRWVILMLPDMKKKNS